MEEETDREIDREKGRNAASFSRLILGNLNGGRGKREEETRERTSKEGISFAVSSASGKKSKRKKRNGYRGAEG